MSLAEAEKYIKEASHVRNVSNTRGKIVQPATRYLRYNEREKRQDEAKRIKGMLEPMNIQLAKMGSQSVAQARTHLNALEEDLELHSPPTDLSPETRDAISRELAKEEAIYKEGFLSHEEMRRNHVGSVDRNLRHAKANKDRALTIKNYRLLLNPDSDEQDLCNLEDLRPSGIIPGSAQHYDANAQIPGHFAMSPQAKENWPENMPEFGTADTPMKQAERREIEQLQARIADLEAQLKKEQPHNSPKSYQRWTCDYPGCGKEMRLFKKGVHRAAHRRMDKQLKEAEEALNAREAEQAKGA